jgi:hypothetical protein
MKSVPFYDRIAAVVVILLLIAIVLLALLERACPENLQTGFTVALTWTFRGGVGVANDWWHQRGSASNGFPTADSPNPPAPSG